MGQFLGVRGGASLAGVKPEILDIVKNAIAAQPYAAEIISGAEHRNGDLGNHGPGYALDVQLYKTGPDGKLVKLPNEGTAAYSAYEAYAQAARVYQQQKYPNLPLRTGLGFNTTRNSTTLDPMHLDIRPGGPMPLYNWDKGGVGQFAKFSNGGLAGANGQKLVTQYKTAIASGIPTPASNVGSGSASTQTASAYANPPTPRPDPRSSALSAISAATKPNNALSANAGDSLAFNPIKGGPSLSDGLTIGNADAAMFPDGMMHPLMTPNASANFDAPTSVASTNAPGQVGQSPMIPTGSGSSSMAMNGRAPPRGSGSSSMAMNDRLAPSGTGASIMMMNDPATQGITASGSSVAATGQPGLTGGAVHIPPASGVTGSASGGIGQGATASGTAYFPGSLNHELYPNGEPTYKGNGPLSDIPSWANHNAPYSVTYPPAASPDHPGTMLGGAVRQVPSSALQPMANGLSALSGAFGSQSSGSSSSGSAPATDDSWAKLLHSLTNESPSISGMSAGDLATAAAPVPAAPVRTVNPAYTKWLNSAGAPVGVKANALGMIGQGGFASGAINMGMHPALAPPAAAPRGPAPAQYIYTQPQAQPAPPPPPQPIAVSNGYNYMKNSNGTYTNVGQVNPGLTPAQQYDLANRGQSSSGNSSSLSSLSSRG